MRVCSLVSSERATAMNADLSFAFLLTLLAGLSTGIGGLIVFFSTRANRSLLSLGLGFSAGVMVYISFVELFPAAEQSLSTHYGAQTGRWITVAGFFAGMAAIALIDKLVPDPENPHEAVPLEEGLGPPARRSLGHQRLLRLGVLTAMAIAIHNFPEGLATLVAAMDDPARGISVAIAIAIHNIPEGIAVAVPIFYATGSRRKALTHAFLSGAAEPAGAIVGYLLVAALLPEHAMGTIEAAVAGIMVFISLDQLIPNAHTYAKGHLPMYGLLGGMAIMAITLLIV